MLKTNNFEIRQITDEEEVISIGRTLINALEVRSVAQRYLSTSKLFGVFQGSKITYMLEVKDGQILQFRGYRNSPGLKSDIQEVTQSLIDHKIISQ